MRLRDSIRFRRAPIKGPTLEEVAQTRAKIRANRFSDSPCFEILKEPIDEKWRRKGQITFIDSAADRWMDRVLGLPTFDRADFRTGDCFSALPRSGDPAGGATPPQPTPMKTLLKAIDLLEVSPDDVIYDVGSGTGKAAMTFSLLTEAKKVKGIECEPAYSDFAARRAGELGIPVDFATADVRDIDLSDGTVFFFFNSFMTAESLDPKLNDELFARIAQLGEERPIKVAAYGPIVQRFDDAADAGAFRLLGKTPGVEFSVFESIPKVRR